jgi:hypothetical protein
MLTLGLPLLLALKLWLPILLPMRDSTAKLFRSQQPQKHNIRKHALLLDFDCSSCQVLDSQIHFAAVVIPPPSTKLSLLLPGSLHSLKKLLQIPASRELGFGIATYQVDAGGLYTTYRL